jgi:hypothetical protein
VVVMITKICTLLAGLVFIISLTTFFIMVLLIGVGYIADMHLLIFTAIGCIVALAIFAIGLLFS